MKSIDRELLFILCDIVYSYAMEEKQYLGTPIRRKLIKEAIEQRRKQKYSEPKEYADWVREHSRSLMDENKKI